MKVPMCPQCFTWEFERKIHTAGISTLSGDHCVGEKKERKKKKFCKVALRGVCKREESIPHALILPSTLSDMQR